MLIYNVTIKLDAAIEAQWVKWMNEEHIPDIMNCGCFEKFQFVKLLDIDDSEGPTYAIQYYAISKSQYNRYIEIHAANMRKASSDKWGDNFVAFRTLMEVVA
jgi:hypothetical protein